MTRKKSRKIGQIGIPKSTTGRPEKTDGRIRIRKGNKSGTRQQVGHIDPASTSNKHNDRKLGSKVAIDLSKYEDKATATKAPSKVANKQITFATPQAELDAIENDKALEALIEKQENGDVLTAKEQTYVSEKTNRYRELCELLGIDVEQYEEESELDDDPFANLDAIKIEDFKD